MYFSAIPSVELASAEGTTGGYSGKKQDCAALRFGLAPTGRQLISSARRMAGPLGLKILFCSWTWPSGPGYWNGRPFGPETQVSGRLNASQQNNALNVCCTKARRRKEPVRTTN